jgi:trans-aconitate methyltransferase
MSAAADYSSHYDPDCDFDRWYSTFTARRLVARIPLAARILELGSATGAITQAIAAPGRSIVCVERAAAYVALARQRALPGVTLHHSTIEAFDDPVPFDCILAINVLHELPDQAAALRRIARLLAPGGRVHVTLPNPHSLHRLSALGAGLIDDPGALSDRGRSLHTLRLQAADAVAEAMRQAGLQEVWREAIMPKPLPNGLMAMLSDELIEAWDALSPHLPGHGALTYFGFTHAE